MVIFKVLILPSSYHRWWYLELWSYHYPFIYGDLCSCDLTIILSLILFVTVAILPSIFHWRISFIAFSVVLLSMVIFAVLILLSSFWWWKFLKFWSYHRPFIDEDLYKLWSYLHPFTDGDLCSYNLTFVHSSMEIFVFMILTSSFS